MGWYEYRIFQLSSGYYQAQHFAVPLWNWFDVGTPQPQQSLAIRECIRDARTMGSHTLNVQYAK